MEILEGDILVNKDFQIIFKNGDFAFGDAPKQHIAGILEASVGNWREHPTLGANLFKQIDSPNDIRELEQIIRLALQKDGYVIDELELSKSNGSYEFTIINAVKISDETKSML